MRELETDYLVVGSGAMGMGFVDSLIDESDAEVVMVDRRHRPGGHWNDAYPFVRLHAPSATYGVGSPGRRRQQLVDQRRACVEQVLAVVEDEQHPPVSKKGGMSRRSGQVHIQVSNSCGTPGLDRTRRTCGWKSPS
jgi:hypothetical protein